MPNAPVMSVIGSSVVVTTDSTNRLRLVASPI
jgi:hypothetical protein